MVRLASTVLGLALQKKCVPPDPFFFIYSFDRAFAAANRYPAAFCCSFNEDINAFDSFGAFGAFGAFGGFGAFGSFGAFGGFGAFGSFGLGSEKHDPERNLRG